jgi:hypothetical protein
MTMPKNDRVSQRAADQALLDGCKKKMAGMTTVPVAGQPVPVTDVYGTIQKRLDASDAVVPAEAAFHKAVQNNNQVRSGTAKFIRDLLVTIKALFGSDADTLALFGQKPPKPRTKSPKTLVQAAAKAKATREARGTKGKKAKLAIKGAAPAAEPVAQTPPVSPAVTPPVKA